MEKIFTKIFNYAFIFAAFFIFVTNGLFTVPFYLYDVLKAPVLVLLHNLGIYFGYVKPQYLQNKYGKWAAITGATEGIGLAYAREMARKGLNIILIAADKEKLKEVSSEIGEHFGVKTKIIKADICDGNICKIVENELDKTEVRILINNVGHCSTRPCLLADSTNEELENIILMNIFQVTQLSRYFVKSLRSLHLKGLIVNISSLAEYVPIPYNAVYAACKAYTRSLTLALQAEVRPYGIDVQLLSPHFVNTENNEFSVFDEKRKFFSPDAETYARSAVNRMGLVDETTGYFAHDLELALYKLLHRRIFSMITQLDGRFVLTKSRSEHPEFIMKNRILKF